MCRPEGCASSRKIDGELCAPKESYDEEVSLLLGEELL
jgi:hypothetical protein